MSLYDKEIYALDTAVHKWIDDNYDAELTPEIMATIVSSVSVDIANSAENICKYMKHLESNIEGYKQEALRINKNKNADLKKIENLKLYLLPYVLERGKVQAGTFKLSSRKSTRMIIHDEELISEDFKGSRVEFFIDKERLKKTLAEGGQVKGAELITNNNLQIK